MGRHRLHAAPRRGAKRTAVRTGLFGASVAVALGTAAVTTGFVPVGGSFPYVGTGAGERTEARAEPSAAASPEPAGQPNGLANLSGRASAAAPQAGTSSAAPSPSVSPSPSGSPSASPSPAASTKAPDQAPEKAPDKAPETSAAPKPAAPKPPTAPKPAAPTADGGQSAEEAEVLALVNQERAQAGCVPVRANPPLAALAGAFSKDMAVRGFFDHTDPDGNSPWQRAQNAGISGMGGENIARGQGDAKSVMQAWMNSPGHKANILNCEFRTLGVGVWFGSGGPWWTQDFGF
ncbi:CAP domain-containing protein [Streptomyces racemochromogenes]|uniref:CAP domain-containing protein n=1 Tax=Streptomyces racemochromogenes TaxID=67353 RepID=UPI0031E6C935